jgi:protein-tyrosine phosphatase
MYLSHPPAWAHPRILVGSGFALTPPFAVKYKISHVINCAFDDASPVWFKKSCPDKYVCLNAIDSEQVNILDWYPAFEQAMQRFLREGDGVVYVHCQMGMNRSAYLALAYVCKNFHWDVNHVIQYMKAQRPIVFHNKRFMEQVLIFTNQKI